MTQTSLFVFFAVGIPLSIVVGLVGANVLLAHIKAYSDMQFDKEYAHLLQKNYTHG